MNRRDFLKKSAIATGAVAGVAAVTSLKNPVKVSAAGFGVKKHKTIDDIVKIDSSYKRMHQKDTAFNISELGDTPFNPFQESDNPKISHALSRLVHSHEHDPRIKEKKTGYTQLDYAFDRGACGSEIITASFFDRFAGYESGPCIPELNNFPLTAYKNHFPSEMKVNETKWEFDSIEDATYAVKKAAKKYGADLVGIAPYDERFVYETETFIPLDLSGNIQVERVDPMRKIDFGFTPKSVIVMAFEMDYEGTKAAPSVVQMAGAGLQYNSMLEVSVKVAQFLRYLGYNTRHCGNSTALSVPYGIMAGLGEGSRMGMLITEEFGPRVRIAKVFTDLELVKDSPKTFGVKKFCEVCLKCSDNCPSDAISRVKKTSDPDNKPHNRSNNKGVDKWYNDSHKCLEYWGDNLNDCGMCYASCPYNKIDEWHHDLSKIATKIPGLNSFARYMDEFFGYGKMENEKAMADFWKKTI